MSIVLAAFETHRLREDYPPNNVHTHVVKVEDERDAAHGAEQDAKLENGRDRLLDRRVRANRGVCRLVHFALRTRVHAPRSGLAELLPRAQGCGKSN